MGRPRPAGGCHANRTASGFRRRRRGTDSCVPFGYRSKEALLVQLGENTAPLLVDRRVRGQAEQGNRRTLRLGDTRQDVRSAASTWAFADTEAPAHTSIHVCHEGCRSLIPGHPVLDRTTGVAQGVIKCHPRVAGKAEYVL